MTARTRAILANVLLLVIGAGAGVGLDHLVLFHLRHVAHAATGAQHTTILLSELDTALHLTPEQHDSLGAILVRHQQAIDSAWNVIHQHVDAGMDTVHQEVAKVLSPEQIGLLHDWLMRQHQSPH